MKKLGDYVQTADWKKEKHVPVVECPDTVKAGAPFDVKATIGKEIAHPNTTEHHIRWVRLFFQPEEGKTFQVGNFEFSSHGESPEGPNTGPIHTSSQVTATIKITKPGVIYAISYCNIHGLWESTQEIKIA